MNELPTTLGAVASLRDADAIIDIAQQAIEPAELEPGTIYGILNGDGAIQIKDTDEYGEYPRHTEAQRVVSDAVSFCSYMAAHGTDDSEVWADTPNSSVVAVIDANQPQTPNWERHRLHLRVEKSIPWKSWEEFDGKWFAPLAFAEFIEMRTLDIIEPAPATMLDLAQHFTAKRNVDYERGERLKDGQTNIVFKETIAAKAGAKNDIEIPDIIKLALRPYIGRPRTYVFAHFRYRIEGTQLKLGYILERPQEILDWAFSEIVDEIRDGKPATAATLATDTAPAIAASPGHPGVTQRIYYGKP